MNWPSLIFKDVDSQLDLIHAAILKKIIFQNLYMTYSSSSHPLLNSILGYITHVCPTAFKSITLFDLNPKLNQEIDGTFDQGHINDHNNNLENKNSATLIVDGTRIYDIFYNQDVDWVYGGDYINLISNVTTFIGKLRENNIEPIFYFEGSGTPFVPLKKANKISTYVHEILEFIREKHESCDAFNFKRKLDGEVGRIIYPPHKMALIEIILRYECKVETRRNLCQEFMQEIVRDYRTLASNGENNILGILSSNIELMFHIPSINLFYVHVYSEGQLLLNNLQCKRFIQSKLAHHLGLWLHQLPLLLVFLLDNIHTKYPIHCPLVKKLFPALPQISLNTLLPGLSKFIRIHFYVQSPRCSFNGLDTLLFGSSKYPDQPKNEVGILQVQCRRYMITRSNELDPYRDIPYVNPFLFSLMKGHCIRNSVLLESSIHTGGIPLTYMTYRTLLRGLIGVLLWLGPSSRINETAGYDGHAFYESRLDETETEYVLDPVTPITPAALKDVTKPNNYDDIWTVESEDISVLRWRLLLATYSSNIPLDVIMEIEPIYVPLCLIIHYLISRHCSVAEHPLLEPLDVKALLLQALIIRTLPQSTWNNEAFLNLKWPKVRTIGLATTFVYGVKMFYTATALCGYPVQMSETLIWHFFDGKLFHAISQQLDEGIQVETICLGNGAIIQKLADLENIVYNRE